MELFPLLLINVGVVSVSVDQYWSHWPHCWHLMELFPLNHCWILIGSFSTKSLLIFSWIYSLETTADFERIYFLKPLQTFNGGICPHDYMYLYCWHPPYLLVTLCGDIPPTAHRIVEEQDDIKNICFAYVYVWLDHAKQEKSVRQMCQLCR